MSSSLMRLPNKPFVMMELLLSTTNIWLRIPQSGSFIWKEVATVSTRLVANFATSRALIS